MLLKCKAMVGAEILPSLLSKPQGTLHGQIATFAITIAL